MSTCPSESESAITYHTHSLPRRDQRCEPNHKPKRGQYSPAPTGVAQGDEHRGQNAPDNASHTQPSGKNHALSVAVTNRPPNEVWVRLVAERPFDGLDDFANGRWMRGGGQGMQQAGPLLGREIQLPRRAIGNVDGDDTSDFFSEGLDCNLNALATNHTLDVH